MRTPLVMGNWKLNGTKESVSALIKGIEAAADAAKNVEVAVCPPTIFIEQVANLVANNSIELGAQDVSTNISGAFTGETSPVMVKEFGAKYSLVGHSERRQYHNETDAVVAAKFVAIQANGLVPVLCIGETLEERETDKTFNVVETQLKAVIDVSGIDALENAVIAYEPVWAIGTGKVASSEQAQDVHAHIRTWLAEQSKVVAAKVQILYGGSVKASSAKELFAQPDIDGGLVGGAALLVEEFVGIIEGAK
ncbi:triosephosphate isomerase [Psychromonas ingrahamii 37]|uniref:Triosephosphate isomerase n=1 Tax=Psychromonas ingrahamii (strain DSM 17664 / CCUG 51855 / 37) TaxID=357804 RepID=TPIS_PSYIN|nr:triose-phosphate isomerase [Psychromonas ingrahamii]A1SWS5.1 RecName: Full=Triosephosphate isomerase; Short=TIM; Short=TPI; AltName: Full=Triose-phosphate isomerase [Psychromonas ingrahamii 37]ABM03940.1 triosephosphate isomerase [Psychromonas ingrahamii 37]